MAFEQRHQRGEALQDRPLLLGLHEVDEATLALRPLSETCHDSSDRTSRIRIDRAEIGVHLIGEVRRQPRHGTELHAMRLLVQAHPESEISRRHVELSLSVNDVGRDEQQAALTAEGLVLPEHLG